MAGNQSFSKEERIKQATPYALFLKETGKDDILIIDDICSVYDLSVEEAKQILYSVKKDFPDEIKEASRINILYLIPAFFIGLVVFVGWILISIVHSWIFIAFAIYGIPFGLAALGAGISIDRMLRENYPLLRIKLRISICLCLIVAIAGYPAYRLFSKQYVIEDNDLIIFENMTLAGKPVIEYTHNQASGIRLDFDYYEKYTLEGSEMDGLDYLGFMKLNLKRDDSLDIFLLRDKKIGGYHKGFFDKTIHIYNIRKGNKKFVELNKRNDYEKQRLIKKLSYCLLFCFPFVRFVFYQTKKLFRIPIT
jgi:hypothetical protein